MKLALRVPFRAQIGEMAMDLGPSFDRVDSVLSLSKRKASQVGGVEYWADLILPHFIKEETEAQREVTCLRSHGGIIPGSLDLQPSVSSLSASVPPAHS